MFETVAVAPPDPILGITEAFNADPNPAKINLSVGVYQDENGKTTILPSVKAAEQLLIKTETSKGYKPISGAPEYGAAVQQLLFGAGHEAITSRRATTAHTPGGTGALRVAADYLRALHGARTVWMSDPTWANHGNIFQSAGLNVKNYPYFDPATNSLAFDRMIATLREIPAGDILLLHGCCHNPTGVDPTLDQWKQIGQVIAERKILPLIDFAYQGFARGLREDAEGLLALTQAGSELLICSSFSKNFGLYNERTGALTVVAADAAAAQAVMSQVKVVIRSNYSNPPAHGGAIVSTILNDSALRAQWEDEVAMMRHRIKGMRQAFVDALKKRGVKADLSFIIRQYGMFSFSGLSKDQVQKLKEKFGIYIVGSGRINVAGMTPGNMDRLCDAIASVW